MTVRGAGECVRVCVTCVSLTAHLWHVSLVGARHGRVHGAVGVWALWLSSRCLPRSCPPQKWTQVRVCVCVRACVCIYIYVNMYIHRYIYL